MGINSQEQEEILTLIFPLLVSLVVVLNSSPFSFAQTHKPWVVGQIVPLTGPVASVGSRADRSTRLWIEQVNKDNGIRNRPVSLITCNDEARPEKAAACARDMIEKGAVVILGNTLTASLRAVMPQLRNGPIMLVPSPNLVPAGDTYVFQVSPSDQDLMQAIANYLKLNNANKLGMVAATDATGEVSVASARDVFQKENIELRLARLDPRATDATTQLATVAGSDVPLVYSSYSGGGAVTVVKSFKNLGLKQPLLVSYANVTETFVGLIRDIRPPRLLGMSIAGFIPELLSGSKNQAHARAAHEAYRARYSENADTLNIVNRIQLDVVEALLRNVADPSDAIAAKQYLESTTINSVHDIQFSSINHVGVAASAVVLLELKDDTWVLADPLR